MIRIIKKISSSVRFPGGGQLVGQLDNVIRIPETKQKILCHKRFLPFKKYYAITDSSYSQAGGNSWVSRITSGTKDTKDSLF